MDPVRQTRVPARVPKPISVRCCWRRLRPGTWALVRPVPHSLTHRAVRVRVTNPWLVGSMPVRPMTSTVALGPRRGRVRVRRGHPGARRPLPVNTLRPGSLPVFRPSVRYQTRGRLRRLGRRFGGPSGNRHNPLLNRHWLTPLSSPRILGVLAPRLRRGTLVPNRCTHSVKHHELGRDPRTPLPPKPPCDLRARAALSLAAPALPHSFPSLPSITYPAL